MLVHANQKTEEGRMMQDVHSIKMIDQSLLPSTSHGSTGPAVVGKEA